MAVHVSVGEQGAGHRTRGVSLTCPDDSLRIHEGPEVGQDVGGHVTRQPDPEGHALAIFSKTRPDAPDEAMLIRERQQNHRIGTEPDRQRI